MTKPKPKIPKPQLEDLARLAALPRDEPVCPCDCISISGADASSGHGHGHRWGYDADRPTQTIRDYHADRNLFAVRYDVCERDGCRARRIRVDDFQSHTQFVRYPVPMLAFELVIVYQTEDGQPRSWQCETRSPDAAGAIASAKRAAQVKAESIGTAMAWTLTLAGRLVAHDVVSASASETGR